MSTRKCDVATLFDAPQDGQIVKAARLSKCGRYRYTLERTWSDESAPVLFVMLNPSTADADIDDPTIKKCIGFAQRWGAGGISVVNLYAWRATKPKDLPSDRTAIGELTNVACHNTFWIDHEARKASRIVVAWGANAGPIKYRAQSVYSSLRGMESDYQSCRRIEALRLTKDGHPWHPLYVPYETSPVVFEGYGTLPRWGDRG